MDQGDSPIYTGPYSLRTAEGVGVPDGAQRELRKKLAFGLNRARKSGYSQIHIPDERGSLLTGERYLIQWKIDNSTIIPQVTVFPPTEIQPEIETCTNLLSGLADVWYNNGEDGVETLRRFYPRAALGDYLPQWWNPATEQYEELYPGWNTELFEDAYNSFLDRIPGRFSGLMRTVVQDMLGRGAPVAYDYRHSRTHGIFVSNLTGEHWVVEIRKSSVAAWPIQKCEDGSPHEFTAGLDYIPATYNREGLDADGVTIYLTSTNNQNITEAYRGNFGVKGPYCDELGWAFSYDGHEASNVVYEDRNRTDNPATGGLTYSYSYLYTIEINEGADGAPSTYTVKEVEGDWMYGDRITHFKFPNYYGNTAAGESGPTLKSFDWFRGHPTPPYASGTELTCPIYCWYENNTLQLVRFKSAGGVENRTLTSDPGWYFTSGISGDSAAAQVPTEAWGSGSDKTDMHNEFESPAGFGFEDGQYQTSGTVTKWVKETTQDHFTPSNGGGGDPERLVYNPVDRWSKQTVYNADVSDRVSVDVVVAPLNDREAIYHFRTHKSGTYRTRLQVQGRTYYYNGQGKVGGMVNSQPCYATSQGLSCGLASRCNIHSNGWNCGNQTNMLWSKVACYPWYNPCAAAYGWDKCTMAVTACGYGETVRCNGDSVPPGKYYMGYGEGSWNENCTDIWGYKNYLNSIAECGALFATERSIQTGQPYTYEGITATQTDACDSKRYTIRVRNTITQSTSTTTVYDYGDYIGGYCHPTVSNGKACDYNDYSVIDNRVYDYSCVARVRGTNYTITADAAMQTMYTSHSDVIGPDFSQVLSVVPDATDVIAPIYMDCPAGSGSLGCQVSLPGLWKWPGQPLRYPYNEIQSANACWVGNPQEP